MITPIIILILLLAPLVFAVLHARLTHRACDVRQYAFLGLGIAFIYFFIGHIVKVQGMVDMLPPWVPFRTTLIYGTGLLELVVGLALFLPRYQLFAAKLAIVIFIVFFPANVYAAFNHIGVGGHQLGVSYLIIRAPLQVILIAWTYFLCIKGYRSLSKQVA